MAMLCSSGGQSTKLLTWCTCRRSTGRRVRVTTLRHHMGAVHVSVMLLMMLLLTRVVVGAPCILCWRGRWNLLVLLLRGRGGRQGDLRLRWLLLLVSRVWLGPLPTWGN